MEASELLAGKRVEITADPFDRFRNLFGRASFRAFENQVFDEVTNTIEVRRLEARAGPDPKSDTDAGHVRHFGGCDRQAAGQTRNVIHRSRAVQRAEDSLD